MNARRSKDSTQLKSPSSSNTNTARSFMKVLKRSNNHNEKSPPEEMYRGFGVGGFQRYSFAKATTFNAKGIGHILKKIQEFRPQRDATRGSKRPGTIRVQSSKSSIKINDSLSSDHVIVNMDMSMISKSPYNTDWSMDNISICSQDSQEFWVKYCSKLESLKRVPESGTWRDILGLGQPEWKWIALGCLSSIILGISVPLCALLIGRLFHSLLLSEVSVISERFQNLSLMFVVVGVVTGTGAFFQEIFFSIAGKKMCTRLRSMLFASMLKKNIQWYDSTENDISLLCTHLATDTDCLQHILLTTYGVVIQNGTIFLSSICLAFVIFPQYYQLTLCLLGAAPIMIAVTYYAWRLLYGQITMMDAKLAQTSELAYDVVSNIRPNIILGLERHFLIKYRNLLVKPFRYFCFMSELRCICGALARSLPWVICGIFIYFSVQLTLDPISTHGEPYFEYIFSVAGLMIFGFINIGESLALLTDPEIGKAAAHRILKILEPDSANGGHEDLVVRKYHSNLLPPKIQLINVHFKYPENKSLDVLCGINLEIEPNTYIAIVGPGKSGKTTLANILLRLLEATGGNLLFDNENVKHVNVRCMRKIMAIVEQDSGLIYGDKTISDNIQFGDNSRVFSEDDVIQAAMAAKVHSEIMRLREGYKTKVNALQSSIYMYALKQRLALARALIKNPKILIIDDATSSIDNEHQQIMTEAIENARDGRTLIILSQKIQPIRNADMIFVLNGGEIVEYGDDSQLLDLHGLYYSMYTAQKLVEAATQLQLNRKSGQLEEAEMIDILRQKALSSKASRKSAIVYNKFLSEQMDNMQTHLQRIQHAMKVETEEAEAIKIEKDKMAEAEAEESEKQPSVKSTHKDNE